MHYDSGLPVAVFLGPTLPRPDAEIILPANYYPPVRMGDIYRLIGTGVETIVVIDGVFNSVTPVWQRELLEALEQGIRVIGASSMGALRAAELHPYGMEGIGQIFSWYRDRVIEGDDEVALMHSSEPPFQPLSLPLVNIRHALQIAEEQGIVSPAEAAELISLSQDTFYAYRSRGRLIQHAEAHHWPCAEPLAAFLQSGTPDLKAEDAKLALQTASQPPRKQQLWEKPRIAPQRAEQFKVTAWRYRGLHREDGTLIKASDLLAALENHTDQLPSLYQSTASSFFLGQVMDAHGIECPTDFLTDYRHRWRRRYASQLPEAIFLRRNGLTQGEFTELVDDQGRIEWLLRHPEAAGLAARDDLTLVRAVLPNAADSAPLTEACSVPGLTLPASPDLGLRIRLLECRLIASWARNEGIDCPEEVVQHNWQALGLSEAMAPAGLGEVLADRAMTDWLIAEGPGEFGWVGWESDIAILQRLQITGKAA